MFGKAADALLNEPSPIKFITDDMPTKLYNGKHASCEYICLCMCGAQFMGSKRDSVCQECEDKEGL